MNGETEVKNALDTLQLERNRIGAGVETPQPLVVIMTPSIDHSVTLGYNKSHMETMALLSQNGWGSSWQSFGGDPYLAKVRNLCVSTCLVNFPTASHLFFIDADLEWEPEAFLRFVQHPAPIVAGVYCKKSDAPDFPCNLMADKETGQFLKKDGLYMSAMVPTGFLCVRREVYAAQAARSPRYRDSMGKGTICWNIFEMGFCAEPQPDGMDGQWWGEDPAWCRRTLTEGYDILVDPTAKFGHRGQKTWSYGFEEYVRAYENGTAQVIERTPPDSKTRIVGVEALAAE